MKQQPDSDLMLLFTESDKENYRSFFSGLKLSLQLEREFCEWLPEIGYARGMTVSAILALDEMAVIGNSTKLNGPQKLEKIREILYRMKYPELSQVKDRWSQAERKVNPDRSKVRIVADPCFEASGVTITLQVSTKEELYRLLESLRSADEKNLDILMDPFSGN